jgi:hypothetical protein
MTEKKRKTLYWVFKIIGIVVSCLLPIWAICEKFPLWKVEYGTDRTVGAGGILILIVMLVIFRKTVFNFINDRLKLKHAPPLVVWLVMLVIAYVLTYINNFIQDLTTVFWMGLIGCAIGTVLTFIAENSYGKKDEK